MKQIMLVWMSLNLAAVRTIKTYMRLQLRWLFFASVGDITNAVHVTYDCYLILMSCTLGKFLVIIAVQSVMTISRKPLRLVDTTLQICKCTVAFLRGDRKFSISYDAAVHCKFAATSDWSERAFNKIGLLTQSSLFSFIISIKKMFEGRMLLLKRAVLRF